MLVTFEAYWGELGGYHACNNFNIAKYSNCFYTNTTNCKSYLLTFGPSFVSKGLPFQSFFQFDSTMSGLWSVIPMWIVMLGVPIGLLAVVGSYCGAWNARAPWLAGTLYGLMWLQQFAHCFNVIALQSDASFDPLLLVAAVEAPFKYYIMLLDSQFWSSLSPTLGNNPAELDGLGALSEELLPDRGKMQLQTVVTELREMDRTASIWAKVKHFHHASIRFSSEELGRSQHPVVKASVGSEQVAAKSIMCDDLLPDELHTYCYELLIASLLQDSGRDEQGSEHIVKHLGFCVEPPRLHIIMERCEATPQSQQPSTATLSMTPSLTGSCPS